MPVFSGAVKISSVGILATNSTPFFITELPAAPQVVFRELDGQVGAEAVGIVQILEVIAVQQVLARASVSRWRRQAYTAEPSP